MATGGSPWASSNISGLLASQNSSLQQGAELIVTGADPYIYLPQSSCDAIAAQLSVTYDSGLGLYLWNTSDAQHSKIITSPSYLAFTFSENAVNNANITIKVPFALLNLTLEAPLVQTPTLYFPCMGTNGTYVLGRAFLQAAFVGVNWSTGTGSWFLAQAPGPGYSRTPSTTSIGERDTTITGSTSSWEDTWSNFWTSLPLPGTNTSTTPSSTTDMGTRTRRNSGLSKGAKAGTGIGCAIAAISVIALASWYIHRRRRLLREPQQQQQGQVHGPSQGSNYRSSGFRQQSTKVPVEDFGGYNNWSTKPKGNMQPTGMTHELGLEPVHSSYELPAN